MGKLTQYNRMVCILVMGLAGATAQAGYDQSWFFADNYLPGEYPNGFGVTAEDVVVNGRAATDPELARVVACPLPKNAVYHPWNRLRAEETLFATYSKIVKMIAKEDFNYPFSEGAETSELQIKKGDVVEFLIYGSEGYFTARYNGRVFGAAQDLYTHLEPVPDDAYQMDEWLQVACTNGAKAWIFFPEVEGTPGLTTNYMDGFVSYGLVQDFGLVTIFEPRSAKQLMLAALKQRRVAAAPPADDCDFIRAKLASGNLRIVIPSGNYICKRPIVVNKNGTSLVGEGKVVLKLADKANSPLLILGNIETPPEPVHDLYVANLTLDGNRKRQEMECWGGPCDSGGVKNIRNNGITVRGVRNAVIKDIKIERMRSGGIVTEKGCSGLYVTGLSAKDNFFDGFAGYQTTGSIFENLDLSENLGAGISLDIQFNENIFRKSRLYKNMNVGFFMRDSSRNSFEALKITDSGSHGVYLSLDVEVNTCPFDNRFVDIEISGAKGNGFHLNNAACTGNQLIRSKIEDIRDGKDIFEEKPGALRIIN